MSGPVAGISPAAARGVFEIAQFGWGNGTDGMAQLTFNITAAVAAGLARTMVDGYTVQRHTWLTDAGVGFAVARGWTR